MNRAGGLIACFLVLFAALPALDALVCEADGSPAAHAVAETSVAPDHHDQRGHSDVGGVCIHGHCHPTAVQAPTSLVVETAVPAPASPHRLTPVSFAVSDRHFRLIRPPRA